MYKGDRRNKNNCNAFYQCDRRITNDEYLFYVVIDAIVVLKKVRYTN